MENDASGVVLASVVVIAGTTAIRLVKEGKWQGNTGKVIIFAFLLAIALLVVNAVSPTMAKVLAGLGSVGAFIVNGPTIFNTVSTVGGTGHFQQFVDPGGMGHRTV